MGYAHSDADNGWLACCFVRGHRDHRSSFIRLFNKVVSDVSGRQELGTNASCDKEGIRCRQELLQPQSVWVKLPSWETDAAAEQFGLDKCAFRILGRARGREKTGW